MNILREAQIEVDPNFRVMGTQNTEGRGDTDGLFHGRAMQDESVAGPQSVAERLVEASPGIFDPGNAGLVKSKAFVVLRDGEQVDAETLKAFVKERLAPYKYPRFIEFIDELPKTATGKIQRFRLREREAGE